MVAALSEHAGRSVRSTLIELNSGRSEEDKVEVQDREVGIPSFEAS